MSFLDLRAHSFILLNNSLLIVWMYHSLLIYSFTEWHLGCFQFGVIMKKAPINISVPVFVWHVVNDLGRGVGLESFFCLWWSMFSDAEWETSLSFAVYIVVVLGFKERLPSGLENLSPLPDLDCPAHWPLAGSHSSLFPECSTNVPLPHTPPPPTSWTLNSFFFFCFLGLYPRHMEIPRIGVE